MNMAEKVQISIRRALGFVTNVDAVDLVSNYFKRVRGLRNSGESYLAQRDYGTKHRYASYPTGITIKQTFRFIDPTTGTEYDVVAGLDSSNNLRFYVWDTDPLDSTAKWMEITRKLTAKVNEPTGILGTDTEVDIDTIVDILGNAVTLSANEVETWVCYNSTRGNHAIVTNSGASKLSSFLGTYLGATQTAISAATNAAPIVLTVGSTASFPTGRICDVVDVGGNTAANGPWEIQNDDATHITLRSSKGNAAYTSGGTLQTGLCWANNDDLVLFRVQALASIYDYTQGTVPHIRFNAIEQQKKLNVYAGNASSVTATPTMTQPVQVQRKTETQNYFYNSSGAPLLIYDFAKEFRWFMDAGGGGLTTFHSALGTPSAPQTAATNGSLEWTDENGNLALVIRYAVTFASLAPFPEFPGLSVRFTLMYDGYEESDQVHTIYLLGTAALSPIVTITNIFVNPARLNKRISGINIYTAGADATVALAADGWTPADSEYSFTYGLPVRGNETSVYGESVTFPYSNISWAVNVHSQFAYSMFTTASGFAISGVTWGYALASATASLATRLNHASDITRTALTPRYAVKVTRSQGSVVIADQDNSTLRLSSYDGDLVHEDDNFPLRSVDSSGNPLRIVLTSTDTLNGLAVNNSIVCAFKTREIERYDLYSGVQDLVPADFLARRSLVTTPYGLFWAGNTGIYWMPNDGGPIVLINKVWQNFYDGSLLIPDGSLPYITTAYRAAIIAGYNPYYQEVWFHCQVSTDAGSSEYLNFRFSPEMWRQEPARAWMVRKLNIGSSAAVVDFGSVRSDGTLIIAYASGLLKYPYISKDDGTETQYRYQDDVTSVDATASKGIPVDFTLHIGEISGQLTQHVLRQFLPEFVSEVLAGTWPLLTFTFYANGDTNAFDTQTWPLADDIADLAMLEEFGKISELEIKGSLAASTDERDAKRLDISGLILVAEKTPRDGNV